MIICIMSQQAVLDEMEKLADNLTGEVRIGCMSLSRVLGLNVTGVRNSIQRLEHRGAIVRVNGADGLGPAWFLPGHKIRLDDDESS